MARFTRRLRRGVFAWERVAARVNAWAARDGPMTGASVAALALYALVPWPTLAALPLVAYAALAWLRLDIALALLPLAFPYWFVPKPVFGHAVFPLSEITLGVCTAVAVARLARHVWHTHAVSAAAPATWLAVSLAALRAALGWPLLIGSALFALGATLSLVATVRPHEALRAWRWEIAEPLLYLALLLLCLRGEAALRRTVWAFLAGAGVVAALAIIQVTVWPVVSTPLAQGNGLVPLARDVDGALRATGIIYGSPNSLGDLMERALPFALAALLLAPGASFQRARTVRLAAGGLGVLVVLALWWSGSRGAWVGAAVGLALVACLALGRPWLLAALAGLATLAALVWRGPLSTAALGGHGGTGELRTLVWLAAWHMIRDHPLLGVGLDQFLYHYSSLHTTHPYWITSLNGQPTQVWREPTLAQPHNLILDLWLSAGVLGLIGFAVVLWALGARCLRLWREWRAGRAVLAGADGSGWAVVVALGVMGSVVAGLVHGMVDSAYFVPDLALIFWWSVALVLLAGRTHAAVVLPAPTPPT